MPKISAQYRDERRAHLLASARRCFVRDGFHETSMQDLADEAGTSLGAMYRYFPSKDSMIEAIAEANLDMVVQVVRDALDRTDEAGTAVAAVLDYVGSRHAQDGFAAIALLVWSEALRNPVLALRLRETFAEASRLLTERAADAVVDVLLCVLPGYLVQLAIRGPDAVASVPPALRGGFPAATTR